MKVLLLEGSWDILIVEVYVLSVSALLLTSGQGTLVALPLLILAPGYVLVAAVFPTNDRINWMERLALSLGLSIAVVPLLGLVLSFMSIGIGLEPTLVSILVFSLTIGMLAYLRRMKLVIRARTSPLSPMTLLRWRDFSGQEKALAAGLSIAVVLSTLVLITAVSNSRPEETFTEFAILGPGGELAGYPTHLNVSELGSLIILVKNHESQTVNYTIQIDLIELEESVNGTREISHVSIDRFNLTLGDGGEWTRLYSFSVDGPGLWKVEFLLFREGDTNKVYRHLNIFVRVTDP